MVKRKKSLDISLEGSNHRIAAQFAYFRSGHSNRTLAWSNLGGIAFASPGLSEGKKASIQLYHVQCGSSAVPFLAKTGTLVLSESNLESADQIGDFHSTAQVQFLEWNYSGTMLACITETGQISIFEVGKSANKLLHIYSLSQEVKHQAVACTWLSPEKQIYNILAIKRNPSDTTWSFAHHHKRLPGPQNPLGKMAFVCLYQDGTLVMLYQRDSRIMEVSTNIYGRNASAQLSLTMHGAFVNLKGSQVTSNTPMDNALVVAIHQITFSGLHRITVYRIGISWSPEVVITPSACGPSYGLEKGLMAPVTQLCFDSGSTSNELRLFVAAQPDDHHTHLHSFLIKSPRGQQFDLFNALSTNTQPSFNKSEEEQYFVYPENNISVKQSLSTLMSQSSGLVILIYSNGKMETLRAPTLERAANATDTSQAITKLADVGMLVQEEGGVNKSALHAELSNNMTSILVADFSYQLHLLTCNSQAAPLEIIATALACRFAASILAGQSYEDILHTILTHSEPAELGYKLLSSYQRVLSLRYDLPPSTQSEKVINNIPLVRAYALQASIFLHAAGKEYTANNGFYMLLLRSAYVALLSSVANRQAASSAWNNLAVLKSIPAMSFREGSFILLTGVVEWLIDYLALLGNELLQISRSGNIAESLKRPWALSLLFAGMSRGFLRVSIRGVRALANPTQVLINTHNAQTLDPEGSLTQAATVIQGHLAAAPMDLMTAEVLIERVESVIKDSVDTATAQDLSAIDYQLVTYATFPDHLKDAVKQVADFFVSLPAVKPGTYLFHDTSWLNICTQRKQSGNWDIVLRSSIDFSQPTLRQCCRCGRLSGAENVDAFKRYMLSLVTSLDGPPKENIGSLNTWTALFSKLCLCGGPFLEIDNHIRKKL